MGKLKSIHFVGIAGAGMSGIAKILLKMGYYVSGSDIKTSVLTRKLKEMGAIIYKGHKAENLKNPDIVVISSAVKDDNPEVLSAKKKEIPVIQRAEMLAMLMQPKKGIAVAGTHGKTTTTSMVGLILDKCGLNPTVIIGGELNDLGGNAKLGSGDYFVAEADESDASFLKLSPYIGVVTNVEAEHLDYHHNLNNIMNTFREFLDRISPSGVAILCIDHPNVAKIWKEYNRRCITYGIEKEADLKAEDIDLNKIGSTFEVKFRGKTLGRMELRVPGKHNVYNSLAACAVGREVGLKFSQISAALYKFKGVKRRFEIKGKINEILIVDDYAHHPTEIQATLAAASNNFHKRIISVFQPHRYTRTYHLMEEFANCFSLADKVIITDIYPAHEEPIPGVTAEKMVKFIKKRGKVKDIKFIPTHKEIVKYLLKIIKPRDLVLTMGAGDIDKVAQSLVSELRKTR